jgi:hypothetical protein
LFITEFERSTVEIFSVKENITTDFWKYCSEIVFPLKIQNIKRAL